jgi:hypothetical protein
VEGGVEDGPVDGVEPDEERAHRVRRPQDRRGRRDTEAERDPVEKHFPRGLDEDPAREGQPEETRARDLRRRGVDFQEESLCDGTPMMRSVVGNPTVRLVPATRRPPDGRTAIVSALSDPWPPR